MMKSYQHWQTFKRNALTGLLLLAMLPMTGCLTTVSTAQKKALLADAAYVAQVCRAWPGVSYDTIHDTPLTTASARAANRARAAYCNPPKGD